MLGFYSRNLITKSSMYCIIQIIDLELWGKLCLMDILASDWF